MLTASFALAGFAFLAVAASAQSGGGEKEFTGAINKTLRVRISLSQTGGRLSGSYVYEKVGKSLRLEGEIDNGSFSLSEFDESGRQTGKFAGKFVTADWIEGTWSSVNGKKEMPFSAWVTDGKQIPAADPTDKISGEYKRVVRGVVDRNSATLDLWLLKDGRVRVAGDASWVGNARTGNVNVGEVDSVCDLRGSALLFKQGEGDDACSFTIRFGAGALTVTKDSGSCGGLNVTFNGDYRRTGPPQSRLT